MIRFANTFAILAFTQSILFPLATQISADESAPNALMQYQIVCENQAKVASCEVDLLQFKLDAIKDLRKQGFASWMEVQKSKLTFEAAQIRHRHLIEFSEFIREISEQASANNFEVENNHVAAIKVFMPGSNRIVGWLQGIQLAGNTQDNHLKDAALETALAKRSLLKANANLQKSTSTNSSDIRWTQKLKLNAALASAKLHYSESKHHYLTYLNEQTKATNRTDPFSIHRTVRPSQDREFSALVNHVAELEANSPGDINRIKLQLDREAQRLKALKQLASNGHATAEEIAAIEQHVAELRNAFDGATNNRGKLIATMQSLKSNWDTQYDQQGVAHVHVSQWPTEAFSDPNFIQYLIEQRRAYYIQKAKVEISQKQLDLNKTILVRLNQSHRDLRARTGDSNDKFDTLLRAGQRKELASYHWKIKAIQADIEAANDKAKILTAEESRFLRQAVLIASAPEVRPEDYDAETVSLEMNPQWLSSILTVESGKIVDSLMTRKVQFGYIESNIVDTLESASDLLMLQSSRFPLGKFEEDDDLLRPIQLIDFSQRTNYTPSRSYRLRVGPNYTGSLIRNDYRYSRSANSNRDIAAPSLYNSPYATDSYRRNQVKSVRQHDRAYPFGILRSDLRRFTTPGQPPWYIPGSPNNLRYNQLRTDYRRSPSGKTGNQILNSKNYLDLSRPYLGGH